MEARTTLKRVYRVEYVNGGSMASEGFHPDLYERIDDAREAIRETRSTCAQLIRCVRAEVITLEANA